MKKNNRLIYILLIVCILSVVVMILCFTFGQKPATQLPFVPPAFEESAQTGLPSTKDESWTKVYQQGMNFTAYVCGKVIIKDASADIYFTNVAENNVWLKLRITDANGKILAETGIIKPNEYIKTVNFSIIPPTDSKISLKIMAYEPETYYSAGSVSLNTVVSE